DPDILIMDEPFSALDPNSREKLQDEFIDIQKQIQKTINLVTHDMQEAIKLDDRICLLREDEIVQVVKTDDIVNHPKNKFVQSYVKDEVFNIKKLIKPLENEDLVGTVKQTDSLETILSVLTEHEIIKVTDETGVIGQLERGEVYKEIAHELESVG